MRIEPTNIQVIGNELAILWNDGGETFLTLELVRRSCPCAVCGGEPDVMGHVIRPEVTYTANSFEMKSHQLVGGYAFQPAWADGHGTGLYSFAYLRLLGKRA